MDRIIAENGYSEYHIVTSQFAHESELYAASVLKNYLFKSTGAVVPYFSDRCEKRSAEIRVGFTVRGKAGNTDGLMNDGFCFYTDGDDIVITALSGRGVIYGVFGFLEKFISYRMFTSDCEKYDTIEKLIIPDTFVSENPAFFYRDVYFRDTLDCDYAIRNRINSSLALIPDEQGGKVKFYNFHHSFCDIIPPKTYFGTNPEYFALVDGKRVDDGQICLSNKEVFNITVSKVKEWIKSRPDCKIFSVAQNDCNGYCTCPKCAETDRCEGSHSGSIISFVNRVADEVIKEYPDVFIHTFAYMYSRKAPKYIKPHKNVIVRLCNIECSWDEPLLVQKQKDPDSYSAEFVDNIRDWSKITDNLYIWDYNCNFSFYILPFPNWHALSENLKFYRDSGIKGMLQQGNFAYGKATGLANLQAYITSKLLWDPNKNIYGLIDEFLLGYFGSAGAVLRKYIDLLENAVKGHSLRLYYTPDAEFITDELVSEAEHIFTEAFKKAETLEIRKRIENEYISVRFLRISRMPMDAPNREELLKELYKDVKAAGITEIQERRRLEVSFENTRKSQYCKLREGIYSLYYIMK